MTANREIQVPDIGDFKDVDVIDVLVKPGDRIEIDTPLVALESEKATMEIPSPAAGVVAEIRVKIGDKVSQGAPLLVVTEADVAPAPAPTAVAPLQPQTSPPPRTAPGAPASAPRVPAATAPDPITSERLGATTGTKAHASPSVRKFARELGVDLDRVGGTGPKGRIQQQDVQTYVKQTLQSGAAQKPAGFAFPEVPAIDFSKFGEVETLPLTKIKRLSGQHLQRAWVMAPHVTQFDEADITDLEDFRAQNREAAAEQGVKLTMVSFLLKAVVVALRKFPQFNASLAPGGEAIVLKKYYHIGFAADTPEGLVVPVVRDVDKKGLFQIAREVQELSEKARSKKLPPKDMQGGTFTISSLGGIGGTAFTPIINVPEVAILGVSRSVTKPVYRDGEFVPRLILPLSLSYDHRVIDGVAGARFTTLLATVLADIRRVLL